MAGALGAAGLAVVLGVWLTTGLREARARATSVERAPVERAQRAAFAMAAELDRRLGELVKREAARDYYQYQNLYHDPRGASSGQFVVPSPLADGTSDPLIASHYQIDGDGHLTIPTVNDEVPELSQQTALADNRAALDSYRASVQQLGTELTRAGRAETREVAVAVAELEPPEQRVQQIDPGVYLQNAAANDVYQQIKGKTPVEAESETATATEEVEVTTQPFAWRTATIAGQPALVAVRSVTTPDGTLAQGIVLDRAAVDGWLAERAGDAMTARLGVDVSDGELSSSLAGTHADWLVAVDAGAAFAAAASDAAAIEAQFWRRFLPAAALAMVCFGALVWIVARADKLARERSRFAAAAAHELRTPLAGLQLYGDMLAEGLGDRDRADQYARRIADEAARLGRVVGNVLGFTQLERGMLSVSATRGDAVEVARATLERSRSSLEHAGIEITTEFPDEAPAQFDSDAVARIMQNLLDNADKHTRGRDARQVIVRVVPNDATGTVDIEVEDDGPGVARRLRPGLFRAFDRGASDDGPSGLGLGLSLARALARAQGGDLTYADGKSGAKFVLRLAA